MFIVRGYEIVFFGLCNAIARLVEKELTKQGAKVIMTRTADVTKLKRPDYGIYWGNLALAPPTVAPCLLLELGFMINPKSQQQLAEAITDGVFAWLKASLS